MKKVLSFFCTFIFSIICFAQVDNIKLTASKMYNPEQWIDGDTILNIPAKFVIPSELNVISGNAGEGKAILYYKLGTGKFISITYKGNEEEGIRKKTNQNGSKYFFEGSSDHSIQPGTYVLADNIKLHVENGNHKAGTTVILLPLSINNQYGLKRCSNGGTVSFWFDSDTKMNSVIWSWSSGSITANLIAGPSNIYLYGSAASSPTYNGPYTVTVHYSNGSTFVKTLSSLFETVVNPPSITVTASPNPVCKGGTVTLTASGAGTGGTYTWTASNGFIGSGATVSNNPTANTTYYATGINSTGCSGSASLNVSTTQLPLTISLSGQNCPGNNVTLTASGATSYIWSGPTIVGANNTSSITVNVPSVGTAVYSVTGTQNGCSGTGTQAVKARGLSPIWATYFGGLDCDQAKQVITDPSNNIYVVSRTNGINKTLPVTAGTIIKSTGPMGAVTYGMGSCFSDLSVSKISSDGSTIFWTHYIGGTDADGITDLAYNNGYLYMVGGTLSADYPSSTPYLGNQDGYCTKLNATTGDIEWSRYISSPAKENAEGVTVVGNIVYVSGTINGAGLQGATNGPFGNDDLYIANLDNSTGTLYSSLYFGGPGKDCNFDMEQDANGNPFAVGWSDNVIDASFTGFEQTNGIAGNTIQGGFDGLIIKFNPDITVQKWTKLGGTGTESFMAGIIDGNDVYLNGYSTSNTGNPVDYNAGLFKLNSSSKFYGGQDAYLAKVNTSDLAVQTTRFYGGSQDDEGLDIEVRKGAVYISGTTVSPDVFSLNPMTAYYRNYTGQGTENMLVARFDGSFSTMDWQTYYGNNASGIAKNTENIHMTLDSEGSMILTGTTNSNQFEALGSPIQPSGQDYTASNWDGVVVKLSCNTITPCPNCKTASLNSTNSNTSAQSATYGNSMIYPNPFSGSTNLQMAGIGEKCKIKIVNSIGTVVFEKDNINTEEIVNIGQDLPEGMYFVYLIGNEKVQTVPIIKSK